MATGRGPRPRRADRERQVGAGARACARVRRHRHQCRQHAGLSRARRADRAARARRAAAALPHRLYGVLSASERCSAERWRRWRGREIDAAPGAGRLPILVGGTGLYLRALMEGLAPIPRVPAEVRGAGRAALGGDWAGRASTPSSPARDPARPPRAPAERPPAHRARLGGAGGDRPLAGRLAGAAAIAPPAGRPALPDASS